MGEIRTRCIARQRRIREGRLLWLAGRPAIFPPGTYFLRGTPRTPATGLVMSVVMPHARHGVGDERGDERPRSGRRVQPPDTDGRAPDGPAGNLREQLCAGLAR